MLWLAPVTTNFGTRKIPAGLSATEGNYPDSQKWLVRSPESRLMRSDPLDYYEAEE